MALITIGETAEDRGSLLNLAPRTAVNKGSPASGTGTITSVEMWLNLAGEDIEVATFYTTDTDDLTTRDSEAIGSVASGSKQTFSGLDMDVVTGDGLGIAGSAGAIERATFGYDGAWWIDGDYIPCTSQAFNWLSGDCYSLYGTGETPPTAGRSWGVIIG